MCWAKGHLVILSTVVGKLGISFGALGSFLLDADSSVPGWRLGGLSLWSFQESGVALG